MSDAGGDPAKMNRLTLRFADADLERTYLEEQARKTRRVVRLAALWAGGILLINWALQGVIFPNLPNPHTRVALPFTLMLGVLLTGYLLAGGNNYLRYHQRVIGVGMMLLALGVIGWVSTLPRQIMIVTGLPLIILHVQNTYTQVRLRFLLAVPCAWLASAMFVGYTHSIGVLSGQDVVTLAILLCVINLFGMFAGYQMELYARREFVAICELQHAQDELRAARDQALAATQAKSQFLANMSHELRTPLNAVIGFSEVLDDGMFGELNEKQADYVKDIHSSGKHLLSLINDILDLSKVEAGRMELDVTTFHLPSAIDNAIVLVRERAVRSGIALEPGAAVMPGEFRGDERKFKQIMLNLLSNAIKFTPDGGKISVTSRREGSLVEVSVTDTGAGISTDDLPRMFQEFQQVGTDLARKAEGTGLGLALTKRFCELHGGSVRVQSVLGQGSTFTFTFAEQT